MPKILSLDPASLKNLGVCVSNISKDGMQILESLTKIFDVTVENKDKRLHDTKEFICDLLLRHAIDFIVFERSMGFGKIFIRDQLSEQTGIVKLIAYENKIPIVQISPKTAKLYIAGSGNADKKKVIQSVLDTFGIKKETLSSEHEADAISMAYAYMKILYEEKPQTAKANKVKKDA